MSSLRDFVAYQNLVFYQYIVPMGLWQHTILGIHYSVPQKLSENHFNLKEYNMGLIRTTITLNNPAKQDLQPIDVTALVDTGALHLCIPEHVALQLNLKEIEQREVVLADGKRQRVPYCGPIEVRFKNRRCFVGALVLGDECLLGAIPMEDMDVVLSPSRLHIDVNPQSPNIAVSSAK